MTEPLPPELPICPACGRVTTLPTYVFGIPHHSMCVPQYQLISPSKVRATFMDGHSFTKLPSWRTY